MTHITHGRRSFILLIIDKQSTIPVYEQLIEQLEKLILTGVLKDDDLIPSVRTLSLELAINPNTVQKSYNELERQKITYSVPGKGRFVCKAAKAIISASRQERLVDFKNIAFELAIGGVLYEKVIQAIDEAYKLAKENDEKGDNK
jgi:GntR family transcriptional regulator